METFLLYLMFLVVNIFTVPWVITLVFFKSLGNSDLAGAFIMGVAGLIAIPTVALAQTVLTRQGLKRLTTGTGSPRSVGVGYLVVVGLTVVIPVGIIVEQLITEKAVEQTRIQSVGVKIYHPSWIPPRLRGTSHDSICDGRGIKYTYYGPGLPIILTQAKYPMEIHCSEMPADEYEQAVEAARRQTIYSRYRDQFRALARDVDGKPVVIVTRMGGSHGDWFNTLFAIKGDTLIKIEGGGNLDLGCTVGSQCEQECIDLYRSLR